jgi:guanosine-3',5'-bis(diphosphate) 3'-pyrophosphohydrolase
MKENLNEIQLLMRAIAFASEKHSSQRRKDTEQSPYINHPIALVNVLANEGDITNIETLCAAALHDTIEDTATTEDELKSKFGEKITAIVLELTDDKSLPKHVRKERQIEHAVNCMPEAKVVKLADKICNLRNILTAPPTDWSAERKKEYFDWAANVVEGLRGTHPRLETIFDILYKEKDQITQSESMKTKTIGSLFKPEPQSWGLRGDPKEDRNKKFIDDGDGLIIYKAKKKKNDTETR